MKQGLIICTDKDVPRLTTYNRIFLSFLLYLQCCLVVSVSGLKLFHTTSFVMALVNVCSSNGWMRVMVQVILYYSINLSGLLITRSGRRRRKEQ